MKTAVMSFINAVLSQGAGEVRQLYQWPHTTGPIISVCGNNVVCTYLFVVVLFSDELGVPHPPPLRVPDAGNPAHHR